MATELEDKIKRAREVFNTNLIGPHVHSMEEMLRAMVSLTEILLDQNEQIKGLRQRLDTVNGQIRMAYARSQKKEPEQPAQSPQ